MNDDELRRLVVEQLRSARESSGHDDVDDADDALELTSLELVRLLVTLEEELDVELDEVAIINARLDTVDDIVALMKESLVSSVAGGVGE